MSPGFGLEPSTSVALQISATSAGVDVRRLYQTLAEKKQAAVFPADSCGIRPPPTPHPPHPSPTHSSVSLQSRSRLANGFSATQLCLPQLRRVITAEGSSAGLNRSDPPHPTPHSPLACTLSPLSTAFGLFSLGDSVVSDSLFSARSDNKLRRDDNESVFCFHNLLLDTVSSSAQHWTPL